MTEVTPYEFELLLKGETVFGPSIEGELSLIDQIDEGKPFINCQELEVKGKTILEGQFDYPISISGNSIIGPIMIQGNTIIKSLSISGEAQTGNFEVRDSAEIGFISLQGKARVGSFWFSDNNKIGDINIENEETGSFIVHGHAKTGNFRIKNSAKVKSFWFHENSKNGYFHVLNNAQIGSVRIYDSAKISDIELYDLAKASQLFSYGRSQIEHIKIHKSSSAQQLKVYDEANVNNLTISDEAVVSDIQILDSASLNSITVNSSKQMELTIDDHPSLYSMEIQSRMTNLILKGGSFENQIRISKSKIDRLAFIGTKQQVQGEIYIHDSTINVLDFIEYTNEALVQIARVNPLLRLGRDSFIRLQNCSFSRLEIIGNSFDNYDFLVFQNSNIRGAFCADSTFPETIYAIDPKDFNSDNQANKKDDFEQRKLFYEQMKMIYRSQGNSTEALLFQARELNQHYDRLKLTKNFRDKVNLGFHKFTTNFGTDWLRGLFVFVCTSIVLYAVLILSTKQGLVWNNFQEYSSHYFEFINPTANLLRKWEYVYYLEDLSNLPSTETKHLPLQTNAILWLSKFTLATLLYQFFQAFRKFGKS